MAYSEQDSERLYNINGDYLPGPGLDAGKDRDPAWPGQTPEPSVRFVLGPDLPVVPVARTFLRDHRPVHLEMIREMLRVLPGRVLTRVIGHGNGSDWMASNAGPDGHGSWVLSRTLPDDFYSPESVAARIAANDVPPTPDVMVPVHLELLESFVDSDECWFDHHGGCQAHGYLYLKPGEKCPQFELKALIAAAYGEAG